MEGKRPSWKQVLQQIVSFNLGENNPDPFWLMISRRITKRKMESGDKERGCDEGEPGPSSSCTQNPSLLPSQSTNALVNMGNTSKQLHRYAVLIGDTGSSFDQMNPLHFECPFGDCWNNTYDDNNVMLNLASGDDNMDGVLNKLQESTGYKFLHLLSEGRFSKVFLAKSIECEQQVVFKLTSRRRKVLSKDDEASTSVVTTAPKRTRLRFNFAPLTEEGQTHQNLKHRNIVQMFGYLTENDRLGIVMEWCHLGNLDSILKKNYSGLVAESVARRYFYQMASAVEYIHQMGLIHCDVTCHHFLVDHNDTVKLCDFGFAETYQNTCIDNSLEVGSLGYQPPEYLQGLSCDGKQFDLWALGCCLHKITTARLPFGTDGKKMVFTLSEGKSVKLEFPNLAVRLSEELKDLLVGLLAVIPNARFSMNRIKNSVWLKMTDSRVFIGSSHLLTQPTRVSSSNMEDVCKTSMDI